MSRAREEKRVALWQERVSAADKLYDEYEQRFHTQRLEDYYEGYQWAGQGLTEEDAARRYVINLTAASVESQKPGLLFYRPQIKVKPRPTRQDDLNSQNAEQVAQTCQDSIQTYFDRPDVKFMFETGLAIHEAHFRFGIVEVGYSADFIDNPHAGKPVLREEAKKPGSEDETGGAPKVQGGTAPDVEGAVEPPAPVDPKQLTQPEKFPVREKLYIKRVPAKTFRVSLSDKNDIECNDWVGYYQWVYVEDCKRNPNYKNTSGLKETGVVEPKYQMVSEDETETERRQRHGMVKVWFVWDLRTKTRMVFAEGHKKFFQEGLTFTFLPFADLKFLERLDHYYPKPLTYDWLGPQDEINDIRDMRRLHRKRFIRRYQVLQNSVDQPELDKLERGEDGAYATVKTLNAIQPIQDAPLDAAVFKDAADCKEDFVEVSGVTGEARGLADADTATQANILNNRMQLRESKARTLVQEWLSRIARLVLLTLREKMTLPFIVALNTKVSPGGQPDIEEIQRKAAAWQEVKSTDLGSIDMDISVELASMSPVAEEQERNVWSQVLAILMNPQVVMLLGQSDLLLRKTLAYYGIRNEQEVREIQKILANMAMVMANQLGQQGGPAGAQAGPGGGGGMMGMGAPGGGMPTDMAGIEQMLASFGGGGQ